VAVVDISDVSDVVVVRQWLKQNGKELSSNSTFARLLLNYAALLSRLFSTALSEVKLRSFK